MLKKIVLLGASICLGSFVNAQKACGTDDIFQYQKHNDPQIAVRTAQLEQEIQDIIMKKAPDALHKGTGLADSVYHIPVVFHIIHDYGTEYVSDDAIYEEVAGMNRTYSRTSNDTFGVIPPFAGNIPGTSIKYIGKANVVFHLATKDPNGNPTNGITRRRSYLSNAAGEMAKFDVWPTTSYINIWVVRQFGSFNAGAAAYAFYPAMATPYGDGVIALYDYLNRDNTIAHEVGHVLNLSHTWGNTNNPEVACGDDNVDDTPPTQGHNPGTANANCDRNTASAASPIWDTDCAINYSKTYTKAQSLALFGDTLTTFVNYPDTVNAQNIMDYTYCSKMFTYGQILRMRATLNSSVGGRNNLVTPANLTLTGALSAKTNLAPIADYSVDKVFVCANSNSSVRFTNRSWRDTISSVAWTFSNGAAPATSTVLNTQITTFSTPGWVTASITATTNGGTDQVTRSNAVYAADPTAITNPTNYYQEFTANGDVDKYPIFNYYNNSFKWELVNNVGYFDQAAMKFNNFDNRTASAANGFMTPGGNYSDFFTPAFDLSGADIAASGKLTFYSAGAYRTTDPNKMNDTLQVAYSTNCGNSWIQMGVVARGDLASAGMQTASFTPSSQNDWKLNGLPITLGARSNKTFFRFRYKSGTDNAYYSTGTGNNFYLDRINITTNALGISNAELNEKGIILAPNPTNGNAFLTVKGGDNGLANVSVTDITGKVVFRTEARLSNAATQIEIPAAAISVKGMYLVHTITNGKTVTQKLVVY